MRRMRGSLQLTGEGFEDSHRLTVREGRCPGILEKVGVDDRKEETRCPGF